MTAEAPSPTTVDAAAAARLQKVYATRRRAWAKAVGRPYVKQSDPRPPPGELDVEPDE